MNIHQSVDHTNVSEKNLEVIPAIYPTSIRIKNNKLLPFVLLDLIDLIKLNGQLIPNRTNMTTSNTLATINNLPLPFIQ